MVLFWIMYVLLISISDEPLAANGNHLGFEIHQNSAYNSRSISNIRNLRNRNNGFHATDSGNNDDGSNNNSNIEPSDYSEEKHYYGTIKHRSTHRSPHRKYRRHTNDLTGSSTSSIRHRLVATISHLSIQVPEPQTLNGRLEISCLATIPAHVKPGEQYADYTTYSVKVDIDTVEPTTTTSPISGSALRNSSSSSSSNCSVSYSIRIASISFNLPIILFILLN